MTLPMFRGLAAVVLFLSLSVAASAQETWLQVEARPSEPAARERALAYADAFPNVEGYRLRSGWYAIVLGPFTPAEAESELIRLRAAGAIPRDSYLSDGAAFAGQFFSSASAFSTPIAPEGIDVPTGEDILAEPLPTEQAVAEALPEPADETPAEARRAETALDRQARMEVQEALRLTGFYGSLIDGDFGPGTRQAMALWQEAQGYEPTGVMTTGQRQELLTTVREAVRSLGMALVTDEAAGIEIEMPKGLIEFQAHEAPFARYEGNDVLVLLISQSGDGDTLRGLYDVMQTLEIVPAGGTTTFADNRFTLSGANSRITSYTQARLSGGEIKGFTLVWPAGDDLRRNVALQRMRASFSAIPGATLPDTATTAAANTAGLMAGLAVRTPIRAASGFFVDRGGRVLTSAALTEGCGRLTLGGEGTASMSARDTALGLALLDPDDRVAPMGVATLSEGLPRPQSEIAVAGYPYGGRLGAPSLSYGTVEELAGLTGEAEVIRLALRALPGDVGGPVMDVTGAVLGVLMPPSDDPARTLPGDVQFAARLDAVVGFLRENGVTPSISQGGEPLAPEDMAIRSADVTVLVECWE